jgi:hypothetical protein
MKTASLFLSLTTALLAGVSLSACDRGIDSLEPELPTGRACELVGEAQSCDDDQEALAYCGAMEASATLEYGPCIAAEELECEPGDWKHVDGPAESEDDLCPGIDYSCDVVGGVPMWQEAECNTPLVLRFDATPVEMIAAEATPAATFDITMREGSCISTDWPTAATPWLVLDLDHSGTIDGGHELFGSGTALANGGRAQHGFAALDELDHDRDGFVDAADPRFAELMLWRDWDADRRSSPGELEPLAQAGIERLDLGYRIAAECDDRGNCGVQRAGFEHAGGVGEIVDLYLACQ